jgi:hypothetical protein
LGFPNTEYGSRSPYFAFVRNSSPFFTSIGSSFYISTGSSACCGSSRENESISYAVATPTGGAVPEMDASLIPQVCLLLAGLFLMFGRRKENTEPMLAA